MIAVLIAVLTGYLLGSIPAAYLAGKWARGIDIRQVGSRNMGTMNVWREVGLGAAIIVLLVDGGKGIAAVLLARSLSGAPGVELLAAAACVAGHDFPVFLRFRGGMGGATSMAVLLFLMPWSIPFYLAAVAVVFWRVRNLTISYGLGFVVFPFISWLAYRSVLYLAFSLAVIVSLTLFNLPRIAAVRERGFRDPGFRRKR